MSVARAPLASPHPAARLAPLGVALVALGVLGVWAGIDAARRRRERAAEQPEVLAAARAVGPELSLHAASRWLRHPTRAEPWSAVSDAPAMLDLDPAGALAPPPRDVLRAGMPRVRAVVHGRAR